MCIFVTHIRAVRRRAFIGFGMCASAAQPSGDEGDELADVSLAHCATRVVGRPRALCVCDAICRDSLFELCVSVSHLHCARAFTVRPNVGTCCRCWRCDRFLLRTRTGTLTREMYLCVHMAIPMGLYCVLASQVGCDCLVSSRNDADRCSSSSKVVHQCNGLGARSLARS